MVDIILCQCLSISATLTFFQMCQSMLSLANVDTSPLMSILPSAKPWIHWNPGFTFQRCNCLVMKSQLDDPTSQIPQRCAVCKPHPKTQRVQRTSAVLLAAVPAGGATDTTLMKHKTSLEENKSRSQEFGRIWQYISGKRTAFTKCCHFGIRAAGLSFLGHLALYP